MNLSVVIAILAENVNNFTLGHIRVFGPGGYAGNYFIAGFAAAQFLFRNEDVGCEKFGIGVEQSIAAFNGQYADKYLVVLFEDFNDFGFGLGAAAGCGNHYAHLVAVESMH